MQPRLQLGLLPACNLLLVSAEQASSCDGDGGSISISKMAGGAAVHRGGHPGRCGNGLGSRFRQGQPYALAEFPGAPACAGVSGSSVLAT